MKQRFYIILVLLVGITACARHNSNGFIPEVKQLSFTIGSTTVPIKSYTYNTSHSIQFVQLHDNEITAQQVALRLSKTYGINLLHLLNEQKRYVDFLAGGKNYRFDPNRIFSEQGITTNLQLLSHYHTEAARKIENFKNFFLDLIEEEHTVVALHNNTDGKFSLLNYSNKPFAQVNQNPLHDIDDFFITNDKQIYQKLKNLQFNVVFEDGTKADDDGSLSIYCSRNSIRYVNIETEHGHNKEQEAMLQALIKMLI